LEGEFTGVAENKDRHLAIDRLQLLESGEDEDRCFTMPRLPGTTRPCRGRLEEYTLAELEDMERSGEVLREQSTSVPSEGCSKPKSLMARKSSGFNRKSLKNKD
jgi:hypothetical protein